MNARALEELAAGLCARLGVEHSGVESSAGLESIRFRAAGFDVWLLHAAAVNDHVVSLVVDCGAMPSPAGPTRELQGWMALLDANFRTEADGTARYCRDPVSGAVILQRACEVNGLPDGDLHAHLADMLRAARDWRVGHAGARA